MQKTVFLLILVITEVASQCLHHGKVTSKGKSAICILHQDNHSGVKGIVTIHQEGEFSPSFFQYSVVGLNSGQFHGCHIHQFGDLTKGCLTAGAHYNPFGQTHGGPHDFIRHVGDLGNLLANKQGIVQSCMIDRMVTLYGANSVLGRSIVVHKKEDDLGKGGDQESLRTGNAGARVACGVIALASEFKHFDRGDIK